MDGLQKVLIDFVRLGLKGDAKSVRLLASRLLRSEPEPGDEEWRREIALLLASQESVRGVVRDAARLQRPIDESSYLSLIQVDQPSGSPPAALSANAAVAIGEVLDERLRGDVLSAAGVEPTRTMLLTGPPGVGKTMTARHLASSLNLPLLTVDLAALVSSFLGKTGQNLRLVLEYARSMECVLLVDEFDAVGKRRDDPADVGELKRIVNVLLLELEKWPASSLFIAATNHPELLDRAVWRRFDRVIQLELPDDAVRTQILVDLFRQRGLEIDAQTLNACVTATRGYSGSDLARLVRESVRSSALRGSRDYASSLVQIALRDLLSTAVNDFHARITYSGLASSMLSMSQREIAGKLGLSHVMVGKLIKQWHATRKPTRRTKSNAEKRSP
jgi:SpoVK/Ycf46/Vps4 family AAA+-type ATPase